MSITFEPQPGDITGYHIAVWSDDALEFVPESDQRFATFQDAELAYVAGGFDPMDAHIGIETVGGDEPKLNVANGNAVALLRELGVGEWNDTAFGAIPEFGTIDPDELLGRVLLLTAFDDPGTDTVVTGGDGYATVIDVGRSAGQMNRYADQLLHVAEAAKARGVLVQWA